MGMMLFKQELIVDSLSYKLDTYRVVYYAKFD